MNLFLLPVDITNYILFNYLSFLEYIKLRLLDKKMYLELEKEKYWKVINLSGVKTVSNRDILNNIDKTKSYIYFLSGNKKENMYPLIIIPNTIKNKLNNCRLLML